eukprot:2962142-Pleurochrysis_carterae.AAC.1
MDDVLKQCAVYSIGYSNSNASYPRQVHPYAAHARGRHSSIAMKVRAQSRQPTGRSPSSRCILAKIYVCQLGYIAQKGFQCRTFEALEAHHLQQRSLISMAFSIHTVVADRTLSDLPKSAMRKSAHNSKTSECATHE